MMLVLGSASRGCLVTGAAVLCPLIKTLFLERRRF